ncbi:MAG: acyltransferase [Acidobacteria bacterium]|nr:acyltransferase [Acidobacteriota bacterium]
MQPDSAPSITAAPRGAAAIHVDALRGLAALVVLAYHVRYKFFLDYAEVGAADLMTRVFYVATSFGHDAVMVFFVLSGYLITGTVIRDIRAGRWSWRRYLANRLTRLYVVLIPGLLLTTGWDLLGLSLYPVHPAYTGATQVWAHDFFDVRASLSLPIFWANLAFRQAVAGVPPLGSNSALWSLTYEFAYYLLFPLALLAVWRSTRLAPRLFCLLATLLLGAYFGPRILLFSLVWLMGLAVRVLPPLAARSPMATRLRNVAVVLGAIGLTAARHTSAFQGLAGSAALEAGDFVVGAAFGGALYVLLSDARPTTGSAYARLAQASAAVSYTLYVVHMPLLIFLRAALNPGPQWRVSAGSVVAALALCVGLVAYAALAWFAFESRTTTVRDWVARALKVSDPPRPGAPAQGSRHAVGSAVY